MLQRLGEMCYRGRWLILAAAAILVACAGLYGKGALGLLDSNLSHVSNTQSDQAQHILDTQLSASRVDILILFQSSTLTAQSPAYEQAVSNALAPLSTIKDIAAINTYYSTGNASFVSTDDHETYATIRLQNQNDPNNDYGKVQSLVKSSILKISLGGNLPASQELTSQISSDLEKMEELSFPFVALALILVFGGLIAAGLPLLVGSVSILGSLAVLRLLVNFMDISTYAVNILSALGMGLAIDYSLFMVMRFREELKGDERDVQGALKRTMATSGRTVLFSALTVSTCLLSLLIFPLTTLRSLGIGSICAVLVAMLGALTILPAMLAVLGKRVNSLSVQGIFARLGSPRKAGSASTPMRHALPALIMVVGVVVILIVPRSHETVLLTLALITVGVIAAWFSVIASVVTVGCSLALLAVMSHFIGVNSYGASIVVIIGLGNAFDYALLIANRYHALLAKDERCVIDSLRQTFASVGRNIFLSVWGVCTALLVLVQLPFSGTLHSIVLGSIFALLLAMAASLVVLPLLLAALRRHVSEFSFGWLAHTLTARWRERVAAISSQGAWYRLSQFVMRYPIPIVVVAVMFLIALGTPFLHVEFASPDIRALPANLSARYVADQISASFPHQSGSQQIVAVTVNGTATSDANLAKLYHYVHQIEQIKSVSSVSSIVSLDPTMTLPEYQAFYNNPAPNRNSPRLIQSNMLANGNATEITVTVPGNDGSPAAESVVRAIRAIKTPTGMNAYVGGSTAQQVDLFNGVDSRLPEAIILIVLSTFVLLFLMTGSIVVPLKAVVMNFLSLTATFGAVVFVFQEGHLQHLLDFQPLGSIDPSQLMILFAIAFGLSMDYEVFLLSRIKEQYDKHGNNQLAVATGLQRTGGLITSAALLISIVLLATIPSHVIFIKQFGLGLALAVIMDATVVRALMVPATMRLLGKWNWWPNVRSFGERESDDRAEPPPDDEPVLEDAALMDGAAAL
jgi:uncharacterized membrane protein YdfJ with MMPL/SSD domain